jgi:tetratricopeptide (TPR) repeat protein
LKGQVLLARGNHLPQAEAAFRVALQRAPKWWDAYSGLVSIALIRQDPDAAVKLLREAVTHCDLAESQRLEVAGLLAAAGQPEDAIGQYETVLKVNPKSPVAAGGLAMLLVSYRTDDVSLNRATSLVRPLGNSEDWRLLDAFGWVHLKNQDVNAALPALEKASARRPDASVLRFHLGMAQLRAGQTDQAEKNLSEAIEPGTHFLGRDEAKAVLAQLRSRRSS